MSNPIIMIGGCALGLGLTAAVIAIGVAIDFVLGQLMLNALGYGAIAAAAGTLSSAMLPLVVGGLILIVPMFIVQTVLKNAFKDAPFTLSLLHFAATTAYSFAIAAVGATIFGLAVNPLGLCMVAGGLLFHLSMIALSLLFNCAMELGRAASQPPRGLRVYETPKSARYMDETVEKSGSPLTESAHNRNGLFANLNFPSSVNRATSTNYSHNLDLSRDDDCDRSMNTR